MPARTRPPFTSGDARARIVSREAPWPIFLSTPRPRLLAPLSWCQREAGWRRASQRALRLFLLGTGGLIFAVQVAPLTCTVPILAAVTFAVPTAVLSLGVAWAIWALADMDQARETRSGALAGIIAAFPLLTGALLSLYGR